MLPGPDPSPLSNHPAAGPVSPFALSTKFLSDKTKIPTVPTKNGGLHGYFRYNAALPFGIQRVSGAFFGCPGKTIKIDVQSDKKIVWAITDTAAKNGHDALDLADKFSKRSKSKYKDRADVERVYTQSNSSTFCTLMRLSIYTLGESEDDDLASVNTEVLISGLKVFEELGHATSVKRIVENKDVKVISLGLDDGGNKDIWVYKNNLAVSGDKNYWLCSQQSLRGRQRSINPEMSGSIEHCIRVKHPWDSKDRCCVKFSNSKRIGSMVSSKKAIDVLINALATWSHQVCKDRYNINVYNNGREFVHNYGTSKD
ncbi:hypothetical protein BGX24_008576 [Mortierella sp. AD032]|nr:hypothetical protein BGX24_008576 [Mortierella sp. AD032]